MLRWPEEVRIPPRGLGRVGRSSRRAGRGREALPESRGGVARAGKGQEFLLVGQEELNGPPGGLGGVGMPSGRDGKDQEVVPKGKEESGVSPSVPRGSQKAILEGWERLGGVGRPSWMAGRGRGGWEGSGVPSG